MSAPTKDTAVDIVIAIGYGGLAEHVAQQYRDVVRNQVRRHGTLNATIDGPSWSPGWGDEPATWLAVTVDTDEAYGALRDDVLRASRLYDQEAVAFTTGTTELAATNAPARRRLYRDFL